MLADRRKYFLFFLLLVISPWIFAFSVPICNKHISNNSFKVKSVFYQSWIAGEDEKGTDILLKLTRINKGISFDSIVFRGIKLKVFVTTLEKGIEIKGIIPSGKSRIKIEYQVVNLPDQLVYHQQGERKVLLLGNSRRKKTKIY